MNIFYQYVPGNRLPSKELFWEYNADKIDYQKQRGLVAQRIANLGVMEDWYAGFDLYGGIKAFGDIIRDEVVEMDPKTLNFVCNTFRFKKEDTLCYKKRQSRQELLNSWRNSGQSSSVKK